MTITTANKITKAYINNKSVDYAASTEAKAQTVRLITVGGFNSAYCYTGCNGYYTIGGLLVFRPNCGNLLGAEYKGRGNNIYFVVYVNGADEYVIDIVNVKRDKAEIIRSEEVYIENVKCLFERMYDDYINEYQDGFMRLA